MNCVFCKSYAGLELTSTIHRDEFSMAIVPFHSPYPESAVVFPKQHIDHFTDLDDDLASHLMLIANHIGRRIKQASNCERVGMVIHGYGVAHAHINVFPQNHPHDITSRKFAYIENGNIEYGFKHVAKLDREKMDDIARKLKI